MDLGCNNEGSCTICPYGYILVQINSTNTSCSPCPANLNCARCAPPNFSCTSCMYGMYLDGSSCSVCPSQCASCISGSLCTSCAEGYIPVQSGSLEGNSASGLLNCTACTSPCQTCRGSAQSCTSCKSGYYLVGDVCLSNFNYAVSVTFNVNLTDFSSNYLQFLKAIAQASSVQLDNIVVDGISSGSVIVDLSVTSFTAAGTNASIQSENNIAQLFSNQNLANMPVTSSSVTTRGGSNGNDNNNNNNNNSSGDGSGGSGLSTTAIIILAVVIPISVIRIPFPIQSF